MWKMHTDILDNSFVIADESKLISTEVRMSTFVICVA